jgi:hypothetical protein
VKQASVMFLVFCLLSAGCTIGLETVQKDVTVAGVTTNYVFVTGKDQNGGSFNVMDRYGPDGKLVARDAGMNPGLLSALLNGAVGGAMVAGGLVGGGALIRPSNVIQTGGGATATTRGGGS